MPTEKTIRATLVLLKAPVTDLTDGGFKLAIGAAYGAPTTIQITMDTRHLDMRNGDIATLYTDIPLKPGVGNG